MVGLAQASKTTQDKVMLPRKLFKSDLAFKRQRFLHKEAKDILLDLSGFCERRDIKLVITSTVTTGTEDAKLKRASRTHREGRAFDVSLKGWHPADIERCIELFSARYQGVAALKADGTKTLVVRHDSGYGDHLHFQIAARFGVSKEILSMEGNGIDA